MYKIFKTKRFEKSYSKILRNKHFKDEELAKVLEKLLSGEKLEHKHKDHKLNGEYYGYRECHVQNDILLIYYYEHKELVLVAFDIGSHSELF